ncbi:site-specific integrase [Geofilum rhodophaeum]|uniref:site-specific integrase n=1 Tax=Geofilum rhodophaeum TaxID=1965019 RepID=UPI000B521BE1|nr:site-specific integrase [Geofilum rhodophaeum]
MKKYHRFKLRADRADENGACPIIMVITKNRKRQFISLKFSVLPEYWDNESERLVILDNSADKKEKAENQKRKEYNATIDDYANRALAIEFEYERENNTHWTPGQYKEKLKTQSVKSKVEPFLKEHIQILKETHRPGTASTFYVLYRKLLSFDPDFFSLSFNAITITYINRFNESMEKEGVSSNTRECHIKKLRAIYNIAIKNGQANKENYPFGMGGFQVYALHRETEKRYLPTEYLEKLKNQKSENPHNEYSRQLFLFSYYCYGISFKDMAVLRKSNIVKYNSGEYIVYKRLKTQDKKSYPISIKITDNIRQTLKALSKHKKPINDFLLPIVTMPKDNFSSLSMHIGIILRSHNKYLQRLADEFEIKMKLTSYVSRHTAAMQLQGHQIPEHVISQMLGHKKLETTKIYLDSLDTSVIDEAVKVL